MFKEYTTIALTEQIPLDCIYDVPEGSPLLAADNPGDGLRPGDVGLIIDIQPGGESFWVEFLESSGYTVALLSDVRPWQVRPATEEDLANDRFRKRRLPDPRHTRPDMTRKAHIFEKRTYVALTDHIPPDYIYEVPSGSPLLNPENLGRGLQPGDVGIIVSVYPGGNDLLVEFFASDGSTVAVTDVWAAQARPATETDRANCRFGKKSAV